MSEQILSFQRQLTQLKRSRLEAGESLIDLSMINPDMHPNRLLVDKLLEFSLKQGNHRYAVARGVRRLRSAFANRYSRFFKVELDAEQNICAVMGSKGGLLNILQCLCKEGERVALPAPTYPAYNSTCDLCKLSPIYYSLSSDPDETLESLSKIIHELRPKVIILNYPNNPTGFCVTREFYKNLSTIARQHNCFLINDFVYAEMQYDESKAISLLSEQDSFEGLLEILSLSKSFSVPGWRVAAVAGDPQVIRALSQLKAEIDYGTFLPIQLAAAAALEDSSDLSREALTLYRQRYEILSRGLQNNGWQISSAQAGCCVWARFPEDLRGLYEEFLRSLLTSHGISVLSGVNFGSEYSEFVRFALVQEQSMLEETVQKIKACMQEIRSSIPDPDSAVSTCYGGPI